jgi:hypothetical protein
LHAPRRRARVVSTRALNVPRARGNRDARAM